MTTNVTVAAAVTAAVAAAITATVTVTATVSVTATGGHFRDPFTATRPGTRCPGGGRVWPNEGYWTLHELAGFVSPCQPPSGRCLGTTDAAAFSPCGDGYTGSLCANCRRDHYLDAGLCLACDADATAVTASVNTNFRVGVNLILFFAPFWLMMQVLIERSIERSIECSIERSVCSCAESSAASAASSPSSAASATCRRTR